MEFKIGDVIVNEILKEYGTPIYIYDSGVIEEQYNKLSNAFSGFKHRIHYAMKANENIEILDVLKELGAGIDAVSPYEIDRALNLGFSPSDIVFTPSCVDIGEVIYALEIGVNVNIGAIEYFSILGDRMKGKNIGLRLNPGVSIGGNQKIATAHENSKFGIPVIHIEKVKKYQKEYGFNVVGLHIHTGSNVKVVDDLKSSIDKLFEIAVQFDDIQYIDIGSGLKIKYQEGDKEIDLEDYAKHISSKLKEINQNIEIKIEPGKFLVGNAGYFFTKVNMVKQGYKKKFVGVDSGFNHLIRPMYYDAYHEIINISNLQGDIEEYDVVGQLCEEDTFAKDRKLNFVKRGDILMFKSVGAYGFSMVMDYNLRKRPKEVLIFEDKAILI